MVIQEFSTYLFKSHHVCERFAISHSGKNFIHHEDYEEHEGTIRPSETHFSCPSCASW